MSSSIIDIPKKGGDDDQLGIDAYKNGLTSFISTAQTPLTIAIQGEWGSGKTSLLNSINYDLCGDDKEFYGVWVNTWEYSLLSDEESTMINIITGIINSVIKIIEKDKNENLENLKKKALGFLKSTTKGALKVGSNMVAGGVANEAIDHIFKETEKESSLRTLHHELQKQINECISKSNKKGFLFFIDDLDRINPPVAVQILELLKNIFDLENCIFLLAIDYEVVVKGLEPKFGKKTQENEREFRSFFEKIIQLPFTMPVGQYKIKNLIIDGLNKINYFNGKDIPEEIENYIISISSLTVGANPRAIKRLLNSLSLVKNIYQSVNTENTENTIHESIINIGIFSLQISYPLIFSFLERHPDFTQWNYSLFEDSKLEHLTEDKIKQLSENEYFDEEWEQVLYQLCQKDKYLSNRATKISRLLNLLIKIVENGNRDSDDDISIEEVLSNALQIASVTSYDDSEKEQKVEEVYKSDYFKHLKNHIHHTLIEDSKKEGLDIFYDQKMIKTKLKYHIRKGKHNHSIEITLVTGAKDYTLRVQTQSWYYVKAIHKDFQRNLDEEVALAIKARERYENTLNKVEDLKNETDISYDVRHWIAKNDSHNTVCFRLDHKIPNAWEFLNNEDAMDKFKKNVLKFLVSMKEIKIVDLE